jgi:hypothetical protein
LTLRAGNPFNWPIRSQRLTGIKYSKGNSSNVVVRKRSRRGRIEVVDSDLNITTSDAVLARIGWKGAERVVVGD